MDALYFFVLAAIIATFGISWAVRNAIRELSLDFERREKIQTSMFMHVAIVETIPIILLVFGFMNLHTSTADILLPLIIVFAVTLFNMLLIYRASSDITNDLHTPEDIKVALKPLSLIGFVLVTSIPIVAIIASFMTVTS